MGNLSSRNFNPSTDLVDLKGKVAIVTGGNTGIGLATVRHLARAGAKVYLTARDESRATGALAQLEVDGLGPGKGDVVWLKLDLTDPRDVKKAAEEFLKRETRLDILINNAAMRYADHQVGPDGIETMVSINYIGPLVFTQTLLPLLKSTAGEPGSDVRIVNVSSIMHKIPSVSATFNDIADLALNSNGRPLRSWYRYAYSKFLICLWTKTLQRRLNQDRSTPILAISIDPGGVDTCSAKSRFPRFSAWLYSFFVSNTDVGAYNSVFAAASRKIKDDRKAYEGAYLESQPTGKIAAPHAKVLDESLGESLWELTGRFLKNIDVDVEA